MKLAEAEKIIAEHSRQGYLVHFEWIDGGMLRSDYFPDVGAGEQPIPSEEDAWIMAAKFAAATQGKTCNLYIVDHRSFGPVTGYRDRLIRYR